MKSLRRQVLDRFPLTAAILRDVRAKMHAQRAPALRTPFGFSLAGNPSMAGGNFEKDETELLQEELKAAQVFVDVGANIGFYSCLARSFGVAVVAVEPLEENLRLLLRNLRENKYLDVEVLPVGLGERPTIATLHGGSTWASLLPGWAGDQGSWAREIAVSSFDRIILPRVAGLRTLIKLDIEGAELPALRGAQALLQMKPAPVWLVEICLTEHHPAGRNPDFEEAFEIFFQAGYRTFVADASRKELDREGVQRMAGQTHQSGHNYLFRRD